MGFKLMDGLAPEPSGCGSTRPKTFQKNVLLLNAYGSIKKKTSEHGKFGLGFGLQYVSQGGSTDVLSQKVAIINSLLDIDWKTSLFLPQLEAGVLFRNYIGPGSFFTFSDM